MGVASTGSVNTRRRSGSCRFAGVTVRRPLVLISHAQSAPPPPCPRCSCDKHQSFIGTCSLHSQAHTPDPLVVLACCRPGQTLASRAREQRRSTWKQMQRDDSLAIWARHVRSSDKPTDFRDAASSGRGGAREETLVIQDLAEPDNVVQIQPVTQPPPSPPLAATLLNMQPNASSRPAGAQSASAPHVATPEGSSNSPVSTLSRDDHAQELFIARIRQQRSDAKLAAEDREAWWCVVVVPGLLMHVCEGGRQAIQQEEIC